MKKSDVARVMNISRQLVYQILNADESKLSAKNKLRLARIKELMLIKMPKDVSSDISLEKLEQVKEKLLKEIRELTELKKEIGQAQTKELKFKLKNKFISNNKLDCYVYKCRFCGAVAFINKHRDQLKSVCDSKCKCNWSEIYNQRWVLVGEGKFETKAIHYPEVILEKELAYTEAEVFKNIHEKGAFHR